MIKKLKELKKLNRLRFENTLNKGKSQLNTQGCTQEALESEIRTLKEKIEKDLNGMGWLIVLIIILPLALMQIGLSLEIAFLVSYLGGGLLYFTLDKIINLP